MKERYLQLFRQLHQKVRECFRILYSLILINSTDKMTVSVALKSLQGAEILNWGDMMAASTLVVVPSVIFFMFIQNKIAGGMTDGAVK